MAVKDTKRGDEDMFEERQRILFQCNDDNDGENEDGEEEKETCEGKEEECESCRRMMSDMRKSSIRLLYLELQKNAVQGFPLPNISELTQILAKTLKELFSESVICKQCGVDVENVIERTLLPMNSLYTVSLQKRYNSKSDEVKTSEQLHTSEMGEEGTGGSDKCTKRTEICRPSSTFTSLPRGRARKTRRSEEEVASKEVEKKLHTNFSELITRSTPQAPHNLFKTGTVRRGDGHGKVRVMLRVVEKSTKEESCLHVDSKKKQVMLREAYTTEESTTKLEKGPRVYSFDHIFENNTPPDVSSSVLVDLLHAVVNGNDACLLTYGYPKLGQTSLMVGTDETVKNIGIIPCAISWLYQLIDDRKQRTGARFSIRVSAVEIVGKSEKMKDLLGEQGGGSTNSNTTSPSIYLPRVRASTIQLSDFTELRASSAQQCASYFDAAVSERTCSKRSGTNDDDDDDDEDTDNNNNQMCGKDNVEESGGSSIIFTLHVYQYMVDKVGTGEIHGGRSRLHLIDLSGCNRKKRSRDSSQGSWLPISALGNVIVSLANGTRHIPHRDSKLTTLLREVMGSLSVRINMIASVSTNPTHCLETLSTLQVTSRIHRSRRKKSRLSSASSSGGDSSCDERRRLRRRHKPVTPLLRTDTCQSDNIGESEFTSTSAAEESCDTVIYRGPNGGTPSDRELTDFEHPPTSPLRINVEDVNTASKKTKFIISKNENKTSACNNEKIVADNQVPIVVNISPYSLLQPTLERKTKTLTKQKNKEPNSSSSVLKTRETCTDTFTERFTKKMTEKSTKSPIERPVNTLTGKCTEHFITEKSKGKRREICKEKPAELYKEKSNEKCRKKSSDKCRNKSNEKCREEETSEKNAETSTQLLTKESAEKCVGKQNTCVKRRKHTYPPPNQNEKHCNGFSYAQPLDHAQRKCVSTNTSPCKENINSNCPRVARTCSLDSLERNRNKGNYSQGNLFHQTNCCQENQSNLNFKSNDTIATICRVHNFERHLVTKIADRFALEDEFTSLQTEDSTIFTEAGLQCGDGQASRNSTVIPFDNEDFFIDDDFDTVCAGLGSVDDLDFFTHEPCLRSPTHVEESEQRRNDIIECNNCLGTCQCGGEHQFVDATENIEGTTCQYDSEEDTDEKTNNDLRRRCDTKRNSFGSCDSQLDISPRNFHKHPPSEGVSSGYESMWCESNGTIHLSSENSTEKGRTPLEIKKDPFDEVIEEAEDECGTRENVEDEDDTMEEENILRCSKAERYRAHIKKLIEERQDLKTELHQTLKKLVLNRVPLPRIDDHLQQISTNSSRETTKVLSRENRIIEKKVKVCKSHLQLVACFDNPPHSIQKDASLTLPIQSSRKRQQYSKCTEKAINLCDPPIRMPYKVTSV